ncbi:hypothetical protein A3759_18040 [Thalassolituus sp. HI0120]|nr:hypothetical protein A3759_18040 [Thalassolituus sp. HI0120]
MVAVTTIISNCIETIIELEGGVFKKALLVMCASLIFQTGHAKSLEPSEKCFDIDSFQASNRPCVLSTIRR